MGNPNESNTILPSVAEVSPPLDSEADILAKELQNSLDKKRPPRPRVLPYIPLTGPRMT